MLIEYGFFVSNNFRKCIEIATSHIHHQHMLICKVLIQISGKDWEQQLLCNALDEYQFVGKEYIRFSCIQKSLNILLGRHIISIVLSINDTWIANIDLS